MKNILRLSGLAILAALLPRLLTSCGDSLPFALDEYTMTAYVDKGVVSGGVVLFYPRLSLTISGPSEERWKVEIRSEDGELFSLLATTDYQEMVDLEFEAFGRGATSVSFTVTATTLYEEEVLDQKILVAELTSPAASPVLFRLTGEETKASEVTASTLNSSGFRVSATTGSSGSESAVWTNAAFTKSGTYFSGDKWWPASSTSYHFYASNLDLSHHAEGATVAATTATDVVCAYLASPTYGSPNTLSFEHILARIGTVTINPPDYYSTSISSVSITPVTSGTYNLRTGAWSGKQNGSATSLSTSSSNDLWCVPDTYTITVSYTLTRGEYSKGFTKSGTVSLTAGKTNNLTGTLPTGDAVGIEFSISVTPWGSQSQNISF